MVEIAVWEPTEYKCTCPHCGFKIWQAKPQKDMVCTECKKEFLAIVSHTEED